MTTINIYLTFNGNCKAAFDFYRTVFGGHFSHVSTFGEMPPQEGIPKIPEEKKDEIMHIGLPISDETILMGSDNGGEWAMELKQGNNFSISIATDSKQKADTYFNKLAEKGQVTMPIEKTFWGDYFGMLTDPFGINWMVSFNENEKT